MQDTESLRNYVDATNTTPRGSSIAGNIEKARQSPYFCETFIHINHSILSITQLPSLAIMSDFIGSNMYYIVSPLDNELRIDLAGGPKADGTAVAV